MNRVITGLLIPFLGTALGSSCVFLMRGNKLNERLEKSLTGFAAGVMVAASIWSLLVPAMDQSSAMGRMSWIPAAAGFWFGTLFLLFLDSTVPHLHQFTDESEGMKTRLQRTTMMVLAVTLHNLPEGMAVGVVYAALAAGSPAVTPAGAFALAQGLAIQNFPEGAIISMPLRAEGVSRTKAFWYGVLSGAVEPVGAFLTILAVRQVTEVLPYLLSFAAGAMMYVVIEELIPEMSEGKHSNWSPVMFAFGFTLMMALDVALG